MSTNAYIGIERSSRKIEAVWSKWDNDLQHTGRVLLSHFMERPLVEKLVVAGNIPTICAYIRAVRDPNFICHLNCSRTPPSRPPVYRRPKGPVEPKLFMDRGSFQNAEEYVYLYALNGTWLWARYEDVFASLTSEVCDRNGR